MPAEVFVVLQDAAVADALARAIRGCGHSVRACTDPMLALDILEQSREVNLLITAVQFRPGTVTGRSIAMMTRAKRPHVKLIFICDPADEPYIADMGRCLPPPVDVLRTAALAEELLSRKPLPGASA